MPEAVVILPDDHSNWLGHALPMETGAAVGVGAAVVIYPSLSISYSNDVRGVFLFGVEISVWFGAECCYVVADFDGRSD